MTSLLMTSKIRFKVLKRAGKTLMDIFFNCTISTHIGESICNISEITYLKYNFNLKIFIEGGYRFWTEISLKFNLAYLL